tara:strand:+ start:8280 stop:8381 length:102 start_codon:yes stop_codon:yes gene_type:complete
MLPAMMPPMNKNSNVMFSPVVVVVVVVVFVVGI